MLIQVVFSDKRIGLVKQMELGELIDNGSIAAFRRVDNWAFVGKDPVRSCVRAYTGEERRDAHEGKIVAKSAPKFKKQDDSPCATL